VAGGQTAPVDAVIVFHDRPPTEGDRRSRAPVARSKPQPVLRDGKRRDHVPLGIPAIKERPHGDRPVTIEPRSYQFLRAGSPQPLLIPLNVNVLVVVDLGRDEHPFQPGRRIADDEVAQGGRITVTAFYPLIPRPARVSCVPQTY